MTPRVVVISGTSGAGKSSALKCLEDLDFYCVDNLPPRLIPTMIDLCRRAAPAVPRVALAIDARTGGFLKEFEPVWRAIREREPSARLLFFDADEEVLVQRFSETRRPHPVAPSGGVAEGIAAEREILAPLRLLADENIDTSTFNVHELREFLLDRFGAEADGLRITVGSFGFSRGVPDNADLVLDVRFLPNPHYDPELRPLTGLDNPVRAFVESRPETHEFLSLVDPLLDFLVPRYAQEGKSYLTIALGCTGGRHRSVALAEIVGERLRERGHEVKSKHFHLQQKRPDAAAGKEGG